MCFSLYALAVEDEIKKGGNCSEVRKNGTQSAPKFLPYPLISAPNGRFP